MTSLANPVREQLDYGSWLRSIKELGKLNRRKLKKSARMQQIFNKEDPLVKVLQEYKHANRMRTVGSYEDLAEVIAGKPVIASLKVDGMIIAAGYDGNQARLVSVEGRVITDLPITDEIEHTLRGKKSAILVGDLHGVDREGNELPFNETLSLIRKPRNEEDEQRIRLAVFDVIEYGGKDIAEAPYWQRSTILNNNFEGSTYVNPVFTREGDESVVRKLWNQKVLGEHREGLVVRTDHTYKLKPVKTADLAVVGVEISKKHPNWAGALLLAFLDEDGTFRDAGKVGTGLTLKDREDWYQWALEYENERVGNSIYVDPTRGEKVIEVKYKGSNVSERPAFRLEDGKWQPFGKLPSTALRQPSIVRIRTDKHVDSEDIYPEQVPDLLKSASKMSLGVETVVPHKTERGGPVSPFGEGIANFIAARLALEEGQLVEGLLDDIFRRYRIPLEFASDAVEDNGLGLTTNRAEQFADIMPDVVQAIIESSRYRKDDLTDGDRALLQKMEAITGKPTFTEKESMDPEYAELTEWYRVLGRWEQFYNHMVNYIVRNHYDDVFNAPIQEDPDILKQDIGDILQSKVDTNLLDVDRIGTIYDQLFKRTPEPKTMFDVYGYLGVQLNPDFIITFLASPYHSPTASVAYGAFNRFDEMGFSLPKEESLLSPVTLEGTKINTIGDYENWLLKQMETKEERQNLLRMYKRMDYREEGEEIPDAWMRPITVVLKDKDENPYEIELGYDKPPDIYSTEVEDQLKQLFAKPAEAEAAVVYIGEDSPLLAQEEMLEVMAYDPKFGGNPSRRVPGNIMFLVTPGMAASDFTVAGVPAGTLDKLRREYSEDPTHPTFIGDTKEILDVLAFGAPAVPLPPEALEQLRKLQEGEAFEPGTITTPLAPQPGVWQQLSKFTEKQYEELARYRQEHGARSVIEEAEKERKELIDQLPIGSGHHMVYYADGGALSLEDRALGTLGALQFNYPNVLFTPTNELTEGYELVLDIPEEIVKSVPTSGIPSLSEIRSLVPTPTLEVSHEDVIAEEQLDSLFDQVEKMTRGDEWVAEYVVYVGTDSPVYKLRKENIDILPDQIYKRTGKPSRVEVVPGEASPEIVPTEYTREEYPEESAEIPEEGVYGPKAEDQLHHLNLALQKHKASSGGMAEVYIGTDTDLYRALFKEFRETAAVDNYIAELGTNLGMDVASVPMPGTSIYVSPLQFLPETEAGEYFRGEEGEGGPGSRGVKVAYILPETEKEFVKLMKMAQDDIAEELRKARPTKPKGEAPEEIPTEVPETEEEFYERFTPPSEEKAEEPKVEVPPVEAEPSVEGFEELQKAADKELLQLEEDFVDILHVFRSFPKTKIPVDEEYSKFAEKWAMNLRILPWNYNRVDEIKGILRSLAEAYHVNWDEIQLNISPKSFEESVDPYLATTPILELPAKGRTPPWWEEIGEEEKLEEVPEPKSEERKREIYEELQKVLKGETWKTISKILSKEMGIEFKSGLTHEDNMRKVFNEPAWQATKEHVLVTVSDQMNIPLEEAERLIRKNFGISEPIVSVPTTLVPSMNTEDRGYELGDFIPKAGGTRRTFEIREKERHTREVTDVISDILTNTTEGTVTIKVPTYDEEVARAAISSVPEELKEGKEIFLSLEERPTSEVTWTWQSKLRVPTLRPSAPGPWRYSEPFTGEEKVHRPPEFPHEQLYETMRRTDKRPLVVYVHPEDYEAVRGRSDEFGEFASDPNIFIATDNSLDPYDTRSRFEVKIMSDTTTSYFPYNKAWGEYSDEEQAAKNNSLSAVERQTVPAYMNTVTDQPLGDVNLSSIVEQGWRHSYKVPVVLKEELGKKGIDVASFSKIWRLSDDISILQSEDSSYLLNTSPLSVSAKIYSMLPGLSTLETQQEFQEGMEEASKFYRELTPSTEQIQRYWLRDILPKQSNSYAAGWSRMMQLFNIPLRMVAKADELQASYKGKVNGVADAISFIQRFRPGEVPDATAVTQSIEEYSRAAGVDVDSQYVKGFMEGLNQVGYPVETLTTVPIRPNVEIPDLTLPVAEGVPAKYIKWYMKKYPDQLDPEKIKSDYEAAMRLAPRVVRRRITK